jgi:hypothetical protein
MIEVKHHVIAIYRLKIVERDFHWTDVTENDENETFYRYFASLDTFGFIGIENDCYEWTGFLIWLYKHEHYIHYQQVLLLYDGNRLIIFILYAWRNHEHHFFTPQTQSMNIISLLPSYNNKTCW